MTLSVVNRFPTGGKPDGPDLEYALLLATDSRYSPVEKYGDHGKKVFPLSKNIWAVIAGPVFSAVEALEETRRRIERINEDDHREIAKAAKGAFRSIIPKLQQKRKKVFCLIGMVTPHGKAFIIKFASATNFQPEYQRGRASIGSWPSRQKFATEYPQLLRDFSLGGKPLAEATAAVSAMQRIAELESHPSVGGLIQAVVIKRDGGHEFGVYGSSDGMESWSKLTTEISEVDLPPQIVN